MKYLFYIVTIIVLSFIYFKITPEIWKWYYNGIIISILFLSYTLFKLCKIIMFAQKTKKKYHEQRQIKVKTQDFFEIVLNVIIDWGITDPSKMKQLRKTESSFLWENITHLFKKEFDEYTYCEEYRENYSYDGTCYTEKIPRIPNWEQRLWPGMTVLEDLYGFKINSFSLAIEKASISDGEGIRVLNYKTKIEQLEKDHGQLKKLYTTLETQLKTIKGEQTGLEEMFKTLLSIFNLTQGGITMANNKLSTGDTTIVQG